MNLDIAAFQAELNTHLDTFLEEEFLSYQKISRHPEVGSLLAHIKNVSQGGKRLRPLLIWSLYQQSNPEAKLEDCMSLLLAVELFHIFCLIHDDVMDEAASRHGTATLHAFAKETLYNTTHPDGVRISNNQAILAGDIVFNSVFKLLNRFLIGSPSNSVEVLATFQTLVDEVCIGQMIDVHLTAQATVTNEAIVEKNKLKTAYYSFARPLHLGVVISGRPELLPFVLEFGEKMGTLYQIQDDLLDITGNSHETKKPLFQDVVQNQHTILSNFVRAKSPESSTLLDSFSGKILSETDISSLKELFTSSGAITYTETIIDTTATEATELMRTHRLNEPDTALFTMLLGLILKRKS